MTENELLLANLVTAMQKGLQTGRLDISDMQYLQNHLDKLVETRIDENAKSIASQYTDSLNTYVANTEKTLNSKIDVQERKIYKLEQQLTELEEVTKQLVNNKTHVVMTNILVVSGAVISAIGMAFIARNLYGKIYEATIKSSNGFWSGIGQGGMFLILGALFTGVIVGIYYGLIRLVQKLVEEE